MNPCPISTTFQPKYPQLQSFQNQYTARLNTDKKHLLIAMYGSSVNMGNNTTSSTISIFMLQTNKHTKNKFIQLIPEIKQTIMDYL